MTPISLKELTSYSGIGDDYCEARDLQLRLREIASRMVGNSAIESFAKEVAQELEVVCIEHEKKIGELQAEIDENDKRLDEVEEAFAEKYTWQDASEIMQAARDKGKARRIEAKAIAERLSA